MSARSSSRFRWLRDERGGVLVLTAVGLVVLLGCASIALDAGQLYLHHARLVRAGDAAALAAARSLRKGESVAEAQAIAVAAANGVFPGRDGVDFDIDFRQNDDGEQTVSVSLSRPAPSFFIRTFADPDYRLSTTIVAELRPVDMVLVLDQSGSLGDVGAWDDLQDAAKDFIDEFDQRLDRIGLVSFQLRGVSHHIVQHHFRNRLRQSINHMGSFGDTNPGEGLRLAGEELSTNRIRESSLKVVVLFTDGRPTAFRGPIQGRDRVMAVGFVEGTNEARIRGVWDRPESIKKNEADYDPDDCGGYRGSGTTYCRGYDPQEALEESVRYGEQEAAELRSRGIYVYAIGLGNPHAENPYHVPDMDYLRELANQDGIADADQPRGKAYFAPSAADLDAVFSQVAADLLVRLAK